MADHRPELYEIAGCLKLAAILVGQAASLARDGTTGLPHNFVRLCGETLVNIFDLSHLCYDVDPGLAPEILLPQAVDLPDLPEKIETAENADERKYYRARLVEALTTQALEVVDQAPNLAVKQELLRRWQSQHPQPFIAPGELHRFLRNENRFCRIVSARMIQTLYGLNVLTDDSSDVDPSRVESWWLQWSQRTLSTNPT